MRHCKIPPSSSSPDVVPYSACDILVLVLRHGHTPSKLPSNPVACIIDHLNASILR